MIRQFSRAVGVDTDRRRLRNTDCIGNLNFTAIRKTCCDNIFCHIPASVGCRAINLSRVFPRERTTAMMGHTAIGIDDDFTSSQPAVAHRAANNKLASRIDVIFSPCMQPFFWQDRRNNFRAYRFLQIRQSDIG